ncbi:MAG: lipopolysaccharide biosynthesis protein [Prevotella sp.]|nr:lipopolysaccharide biosynthesis protein [Prevotella sp.]
MADKLKQKTISGVAWSAIHKFAIMLLNFISGIVLARLLTPHDYGVVGMLTIFLAISNTFIDGGFGSALIQKKRPTNEDYSTILYWNLGLSVVLYGVLFVCAPLIARFYNLPLLVDVLRVQGLVLIFNAARIVQRNQLRKQLKFKKVAIINISSNIIALLVTIILAMNGWGVWALVAQQLLLGFLTTCLYWFTSSWKPLLVFSLQSFKELFSFGGFILLSNLFSTLCNNIQGLLIGKVYNSSTLGIYTKAQRTESLSSTFISSVLDQVSYPVLSETQNDKEKMIAILKLFIGTSAYITFPLMLLLILLAKPLFLFLYSERWLQSVPFFQVLCLAGIAICLQNINYYAVAAVGKSKELLKWTFVKRGVGLLLVVVGLWLYGIYGLLIGSVVTSWFIYIVNAWLASRYVGYTLRQQFYDLIPIIIISGAAFLASILADFLPNTNLYMKGFAQLFIFVSTYILLSVLLKVESFSFAKKTLIELCNKFIHK